MAKKKTRPCSHRRRRGITAIRQWDCACSWGCDLCDRHYRCERCHQTFRVKDLSEGRSG